MVSAKSYRIAAMLQTIAILVLIGMLSLSYKTNKSQEVLIRSQELKLIDYALGISPSSVDRQVRKVPSVKELSMNEIGRKTGTDKVMHHGYDRYYPAFVDRFKGSSMNMLEIGFLLGQSFEMWKQYFPSAKVFFMDKDCGKTFPESRYCGDQGNVEDLKKMLTEKEMKGNLDLIVDDGSHLPSHQITSFKYLFEHGLKPGGVYIIEDIEMNYWQKGETYGHKIALGRDHPDSLIAQMKALADVVNREFAKTHDTYSSKFGKNVDSWVSSVFFGHNCVIITKMSEKEQQQYGHREYRFKDVVFI